MKWGVLCSPPAGALSASWLAHLMWVGEGPKVFSFFLGPRDWTVQLRGCSLTSGFPLCSPSLSSRASLRLWEVSEFGVKVGCVEYSVQCKGIGTTCL